MGISSLEISSGHENFDRSKRADSSQNVIKKMKKHDKKDDDDENDDDDQDIDNDSIRTFSNTIGDARDSDEN
jgi:hypothetical protein